MSALSFLRCGIVAASLCFWASGNATSPTTPEDFVPGLLSYNAETFSQTFNAVASGAGVKVRMALESCNKDGCKYSLGPNISAVGLALNESPRRLMSFTVAGGGRDDVLPRLYVAIPLFIGLFSADADAAECVVAFENLLNLKEKGVGGLSSEATLRGVRYSVFVSDTTGFMFFVSPPKD